MIVISNEEDQIKYRAIQNALFDKCETNSRKVIKIEFTNVEEIYHDYMGDNELFEKLVSKFAETYPKFCISTALDDEPIYLLDLSEDFSLKEYFGILNLPKSIGLTYPHPNVGISTTNEKIFFYNPDQHWCLYSDRYNELIILAY